MRETLVIFRRELRSYFYSPIAYVFGLVVLGLLLGFAAAATIVHGAEARMDAFFGLVPLASILLLSGLTMRLWADERKMGTIELLMTFPVRIPHLVLGKFLATWCYLAFVFVLTLGLPLTLHAFGGIDWPKELATYAATLLFCGSFVAVGMFWSSLTKEQLISLLATIVSLLVLYLLGYPWLVEALAGWMPAWLVDLVSSISPFKYFESISRGVLDTRDLVYFACFCGFFLYANALVLQYRRHKG